MNQFTPEGAALQHGEVSEPADVGLDAPALPAGEQIADLQAKTNLDPHSGLDETTRLRDEVPITRVVEESVPDPQFIRDSYQAVMSGQPMPAEQADKYFGHIKKTGVTPPNNPTFAAAYEHWEQSKNTAVVQPPVAVPLTRSPVNTGALSRAAIADEIFRPQERPTTATIRPVQRVAAPLTTIDDPDHSLAPDGSVIDTMAGVTIPREVLEERQRAGFQPVSDTDEATTPAVRDQVRRLRRGFNAGGRHIDRSATERRATYATDPNLIVDQDRRISIEPGVQEEIDAADAARRAEQEAGMRETTDPDLIVRHDRPISEAPLLGEGAGEELESGAGADVEASAANTSILNDKEQERLAVLETKRQSGELTSDERRERLKLVQKQNMVKKEEARLAELQELEENGDINDEQLKELEKLEERRKARERGEALNLEEEPNIDKQIEDAQVEILMSMSNNELSAKEFAEKLDEQLKKFNDLMVVKGFENMGLSEEAARDIVRRSMSAELRGVLGEKNKKKIIESREKIRELAAADLQLRTMKGRLEQAKDSQQKLLTLIRQKQQSYASYSNPNNANAAAERMKLYGYMDRLASVNEHVNRLKNASLVFVGEYRRTMADVRRALGVTGFMGGLIEYGASQADKLQVDLMTKYRIVQVGNPLNPEV